MPVITIDRSTPFDPSKFLGTPGFEVCGEEDPRSLAITELHTAKLRLVHDLYPEDIPLFTYQRVQRLWKDGYILPDGKILEALKTHDAFPESWKKEHPRWGGPMSIHFDGTPIRSSWDGRKFCLYAIFNPVQKFWETPYLGPWAGLQPAAVILP